MGGKRGRTLLIPHHLTSSEGFLPLTTLFFLPSSYFSALLGISLLVKDVHSAREMIVHDLDSHASHVVHSRPPVPVTT